MALVFVAKDMQVTTPVGYVNIHPLPGLPSGLTRIHLFRNSLGVLSTNLVTGALEEIAVYGSQEQISYHDTYALSTQRNVGWIDESWEVPLAGGVTWMAVGLFDPQEDEFGYLMSTNDDDVGSGSYLTAMLSLRNPGARISARDDQEVFHNVDVDVPGEDRVDPIMIFGRFDANGSLDVYVPHLQEGNSETINRTDHAPPVGVLLGTSPTANPRSRHHRQYMVGEWARMLSQSEMDTAYNALKPWLLGRGVKIA